MSKETPIVSVVMSVYNSALYLRASMDSILKQSFPDFEFIIINDGSTDNSRDIILSYKDARIVLIDNETNKGLIYSLNKGIEHAKGKYIARMDADDISMPVRLERQVSIMESNPVLGACGSSYFSFSKKSVKRVTAITESEVLRAMLLFNSCLCHPAVIIRKKTLLENNIRYTASCLHAEDYDLWIQMGKVSELGNAREFLFKYRRHDNQLTVSEKKGVSETAQTIRRQYLKYLGFAFSEKQFETHSLIASNKLITDKTVPDEIENWLLELIAQNDKLKAIATPHFNYLMAKTWYDCCGNTNLGLYAYNRYFKSALKNYFPMQAKAKTRLLGKCLLRRYKK